jgi:hypothetical protein
MFPQHKFETEIYKTLEYGDETYLANAVGKSVGYYSQMLNPEDPRESTWFKAARDFYNLILKNPDKGCETLQKFISLVKTAVPGDRSLCVDLTRRKALRERMEADLAEMSGAPASEQIEELEEAIAAAQEHLSALRAQDLPDVRKQMRVVINERKTS